MRRKASEPDCRMAFWILYDVFLCRKQSHVEDYISAVIVDADTANRHVETNMTDKGHGGGSKGF